MDSPATAFASMVLPVPGGPHQQDAFGHGSAGFRIFLRVVEIIHDLSQIFFGLVLPGHIAEADTLGGLDVDLGVTFPHAKGHGILAARLLHQLFAHIASQCNEDQDRKDGSEQDTEERRKQAPL